MKAVLYKRYGGPEVLGLEQIDIPTIKESEVLVKIYSASVNPFDVHFRNGILPLRILTRGFFKPRNQRLGLDVSGEIVGIGAKITRFKIGDLIYGFCRGSYAEYASIPEKLISLKPKNITHNQAAACPLAALTALQALRNKAQISKNMKVLIYGASGGIGHIALQIAKYYQTEVTAVCSSTNLGWVGELGPKQLKDYTKGPLFTNNEQYDVILDAVGKLKFSIAKKGLHSLGLYVTVGSTSLPWHHTPWMMMSSLFGGPKGKTFVAKSSFRDFDFIASLIEGNHLIPQIDKIFKLEDIVAAHRYVERGHTKGKVIIEVLKE